MQCFKAIVCVIFLVYFDLICSSLSIRVLHLNVMFMIKVLCFF